MGGQAEADVELIEAERSIDRAASELAAARPEDARELAAIRARLRRVRARLAAQAAAA